MEATIKETVKNIFKANAFEFALDLTRNLRGEYIAEYGVKSWNALVSYYKKANIQPEATLFHAAEPETGYPESESMQESTEETEEPNETDIVTVELTPENVGDLHNVLAEVFGEETEIADDVSDSSVPVEEASAEEAPAIEYETLEYMLYRNTGDNVEWFGHRENFYLLAVGEVRRMIRMNNKGVSDGMVVASNALTLDQVALFHRCYGVIIKMKRSYKEQLQLASDCLMKLPEASKDKSKLPTNDIKLTDYVLNFGK